jgi:hypothetical protein
MTATHSRYRVSIFAGSGSIGIHLILLALISLAAQPVVSKPIEFRVPSTLEFTVTSFQDKDTSGGKEGGAKAPDAVAPAKKPLPKLEVKKPRSEPTKSVVSANKIASIEVGEKKANDLTPSRVVDDARNAEGDDETSWGYGGDGEGLGFGDGNGPGGGGGFLGLRFDTTRLQQSALILEIEAFLSVIPGWREVLSDSGIDAFDELDRVFVGSSNLRPSHLVVVGRFREGQSSLEHALDRVSHARGQQFSWTGDGDIRTARWPSAKGQARTIAALGQGAFLISRPQDLPGVLYVGRHFQRLWDPDQALGSPTGILDLRAGETVEVSVEGVRHFVTLPKRLVPARLKFSVRAADQFSVNATTVAQYASPESADYAVDFFKKKIEQLAKHPTAQYYGIASALSETRVSRQQQSVEATSRLTLHQLRALMGFIAQSVKEVAQKLK